MFNRFSDWLYRVVTKWCVLVATGLLLLFIALVLPGQAVSAPGATSGAGTPDTTLFYSADDLYRMAQAYGESGRAEYIQGRFTLDLLFPPVYTFFFLSTLSWKFSKIFRSGSVLRRINLLPIAAIFFDLLENSACALVMWRYPQLTPGLDWMAGIFTLLKWLFVVGSVVALLIGGIAAILQWRQDRRANP